ncbi:MAG: sulfite exporter TauE/SafE family protein [Gloeomargarita sp. GMQP_bins_120]
MGPLLLVGLIAGLAGGMFGIGGGAIMVPALVLGLGFDQKVATGTSLAAQVLPIGLVGAWVYHRSGHLDLRAAVIMVVGLVLGNGLGALLANQPFITSEMMKKLYGGFLVLVGLRYWLWR